MDKATIAKVQSFGFDVYMRDEKDSWLIFTDDGKHIGYLQQERFGGISLSTVHVPNRTSGTGFQIERHADDFTKADLEQCFAFVPPWAGEADRKSVVKWRDLETYIKSNSFNGAYTLVPREGT